MVVYYRVMNFGNITGVFVNMLICGLGHYKTSSTSFFDVIEMALVPRALRCLTHTKTVLSDNLLCK